MTQKEIRAQIYTYIYDNMLAKDYDINLWSKQRGDLKKLLQQFALTFPVNHQPSKKDPKHHTESKPIAKTFPDRQVFRVSLKELEKIKETTDISL